MILTRARSIARSLARSLTHIQLLQTVQLLLKYIYKNIYTLCAFAIIHTTRSLSGESRGTLALTELTAGQVIDTTHLRAAGSIPATG